MQLTTDRQALTALDRCDTCSAAALVAATFLNGELMFCGHHARKYKDNIIIKSILVYDPQNELNTIE
jgi:hypothetical protein